MIRTLLRLLIIFIFGILFINLFISKIQNLLFLVYSKMQFENYNIIVKGIYKKICNILKNSFIKSIFKNTKKKSIFIKLKQIRPIY
jgi:hypothetical protein